MVPLNSLLLLFLAHLHTTIPETREVLVSELLKTPLQTTDFPKPKVRKN